MSSCKRTGRTKSLAEHSNYKYLAGFLATIALLACALATFHEAPCAYADAIPNVGSKTSGTCYIENAWMIGTQSYFNVNNFSGELAGAEVIDTFECMDHTAAEPTFTNATYTATITSVDVEGGWVTYSVYITPPGVTDGHTIANGALAGYQHVGGTVRVKREFQGGIELQKADSNTTLTQNNNCYSLANARYGIYQDKTCTNLVASLTTDEKGYAKTGLTLNAGTYYVKETAAPQGYALDPQVYSVTVPAGKQIKLGVSDTPQSNPVSLAASKVDIETTHNTALGSATLANAQFTIRFYAGNFDSVSSAEASGNALRTWTLKTDDDGRAIFDESHKVSGDDFYTNDKGDIVMPLGTLLIQETKAPDGYLINNTVHLCPITSDGNNATVNTFSAPTVPEQVKRGDLAFTKANGTTMERLANVAFLLTSKTTGEKHVLVTDNNGYLSSANSWNAHSNNTNANDAAVVIDAETGEIHVDENKLDTDAGVWFGQDKEGNIASVRDDLGALPFDTYSVEELPCSANADLVLVSFDVSITRDDKVLDLGTVDNMPHPPLSLGTLAHAPEGEKEVVAGEATTLIDTVHYEGATIGAKYRITGEFICATDTTQEAYDAGKYTPLASAESEFVAETESGDIDVEFTVKTIGHEGHTLVATEKLYQVTQDSTTEELIATHIDLSDEGQSIRIQEQEKPGDSPTPSAPDTPSSPSAPSVRTGDILLYVVPTCTLIAALIGIAITVVARRRSKAAQKARLLHNL